MRDRYLWFLLSLLTFLLLPPLVGERGEQGALREVLTSGAIMAILISGMLAACSDKRDRIIGLALAVLTFLAASVFQDYDATAEGASRWRMVLGACPALFFFYTAALTLRAVLRGGKVSLNGIYAALCVYLLAGFGFGFLYEFIWEVHWTEGPSFGMPEFMGETDPDPDDFVFFSFVTQTTLGYGDITPMNDWARSLAVLQTIFGVFYLAVLIARLVASYERDEAKGSDP